jgi:hypothetical protein
MRRKPKRLPICTECGSADVRADAYAEWDAENQCWSLVTTFDNTDCENCGGECSIEWVNLDSEKGRKAVEMAEAKEG